MFGTLRNLPKHGAEIGMVTVVNVGTPEMALVLLDTLGREIYRTTDNCTAARVIIDITVGLADEEEKEFFMPMLRKAAETWVDHYPQSIN